MIELYTTEMYTAILDRIVSDTTVPLPMFEQIIHRRARSGSSTNWRITPEEMEFVIRSADAVRIGHDWQYDRMYAHLIMVRRMYAHLIMVRNTFTPFVEYTEEEYA